MRSFLAFLALAATAFAQTRNIVEIAVADPNLSFLVAALERADLVKTLSGPGPFTVFAPVDNAFFNLGPLVNWALAPNSVKDLTSILTYHVVAGKVLSSDLRDGEVVPTLDKGQNVTVHINNGGVTINSSPVIRANIEASNGVIHVISNNVLIPSNSGAPTQNVVDLAKSISFLSTLTKAVGIAEVGSVLSSATPLTVFAPNDDAFGKLDPSVLQKLLNDPKALASVLLYHVAGDARIYADEIPPFVFVNTLNGNDLQVTHDSQGVFINGKSKVIQANVDATNAVVHVIDTVLIPPALEKYLYA